MAETKQERPHVHTNESSSELNATQDAADMAKMGKKQELVRNFEFWTLLAFSATTMITWAGQLFTFALGLQNGGPTGLIISFLLLWTAMLATAASLAELVSMFPTAAGQYHWTCELAPKKWAALLSYLCGWQSIIAWEALVASAAYLMGTLVQGVIILNNPDSYVPQQWHGTLLMFACLALALAINVFGAKLLPAVDGFALIVYCVGFIVTLIVVTVMSPSKASASDVFKSFINSGGWSSEGVSWWVGLQGLVFAWVGLDGSIHMAEECRNASATIPRALLGSVHINGVLGFAMLVAILFCGGDLAMAAQSPTRFPTLAIFEFATGSAAGGTGLTIFLFILGGCALTNALAAASRQLWAFARDEAVPGWRFFKKVNKQFHLPLNTIMLTAAITILLGLINLGSSVALSAVVSLTVAGFSASYIMPIAILLYRRISDHDGLPWGPWRMSKWVGISVNAYAIAWSLLIMIWSFFPPTIDPTPETMNWSSLVYGAVVLFALVFWVVDGRKRFTGPRAENNLA